MARSFFAFSICPLVELMTRRGRETGKGFVGGYEKEKGEEEKRREKRRNSNAANTAVKIPSQQ